VQSAGMRGVQRATRPICVSAISQVILGCVLSSTPYETRTAIKAPPTPAVQRGKRETLTPHESRVAKQVLADGALQPSDDPPHLQGDRVGRQEAKVRVVERAAGRVKRPDAVEHATAGSGSEASA